MATNHTTNYQLNQWEPTDPVLRTDFNADNAKLDAALKDLANQVAGKAAAGTVNSLSTTLTQETQAREASDAELWAAMALKGNCQISYSTYVGDGSLSRTHTFSQKPLIVFIAGPNIHLIAINPCTTTTSVNGSSTLNLVIGWSGSNMTVSYAGSLGGGDQKALNDSGETYYIVALTAV